MSSQTMGFEDLLEAVPDALLGVDTSGAIRFVNHQGEAMFGYERGALIGVPIETLVPESVRALHTAHRRKYSAARRTRAMGTGVDLAGRRRDGTTFPVDIALSPMDTAGGMLVLAAVRDLTSHQRAEADPGRAQRLLAIVEYSEDAIIATNLRGIITSWNPAAERIFGYSSEEIAGASSDILTPADRPNEMMAIRVTIRAGQRVEHLETVRVRKDGTLLPVSVTVSPIRGADGAVVAASTLVRDRSEAKGAFEAARSMIEASLDSLVAISAQGKITDANQATVKLTGVPRDKLIGTSFSNYFTEPEKAEQIYQRVFTQGMAVDYPLTLRRQNGHEGLTDVLYNASVYRDGQGRVLGVFAAARDVTSLMQAHRDIIAEQGAALQRLGELEQFQRLTVGRELKMIELKKEIEALRRLDQIDGHDRGQWH